jgi:HEAT repeat protein
MFASAPPCRMRCNTFSLRDMTHKANTRILGLTRFGVVGPSGLCGLTFESGWGLGRRRVAADEGAAPSRLHAGSMITTPTLLIQLLLLLAPHEQAPDVRLNRAIEILEDDRSTRHDDALLELRRLGPDAAPAVPILVKEMRRVGQAYPVLEVLEEIGPEAWPAVPAILDLAASERGDCHRCEDHAVNALASVGPIVVPAVLSDIEDGDLARDHVFSWLPGVVGQLGAPALPALFVALRDTPNRQQVAALTLIGFGQEAAPAASRLVDLLTADVSRRSVATQALESIGPAAGSIVPKLIFLLEHEEKDLRRSAATVLGAIGPAAMGAIPALDRVRANDPELAETVSYALKRIREPRTDASPSGGASAPAEPAGGLDPRLEPLEAMLAEPARRSAALRQVAALGAAARGLLPVVVDALRDGGTRIDALLALQAMGPDGLAAAPAAIDLLDSSDLSPADRAATGRVLAAMGPGSLLAALAARDDVPHTAAHPGAMALLADIAEKLGPSALPVLQTALRDAPFRQRAAVGALQRLGTTAAPAAPGLVALLTADSELREMATTTLVGLGPSARAVVPRLTSLAEHPNVRVRRAVIRALAGIGPDAAAAIPVLEKLRTHDAALAADARAALARIRH